MIIKQGAIAETPESAGLSKPVSPFSPGASKASFFEDPPCFHCLVMLPRDPNATVVGASHQWNLLHFAPALLPEGLRVMDQWGFRYKSNLIWYKIRKDGGPDGRGVGFYFRNVTEVVLFGVRGRLRTLKPGRRQVNLFPVRKREHSRKPDGLQDRIDEVWPDLPKVEVFARQRRPGWEAIGNELDRFPAGQAA